MAQYLGKTFNEPIESVEIQKWEGGKVQVRLDCTEFRSHCPVTNQPDHGKLEILYQPSESFIETKSLKLYLWKFSSERAFNEQLADRICQELFDVVAPDWIEVKGIFNPRGGISVTCTSRREKE